MDEQTSEISNPETTAQDMQVGCFGVPWGAMFFAISSLIISSLFAREIFEHERELFTGLLGAFYGSLLGYATAFMLSQQKENPKRAGTIGICSGLVFILDVLVRLFVKRPTPQNSLHHILSTEATLISISPGLLWAFILMLYGIFLFTRRNS